MKLKLIVLVLPLAVCLAVTGCKKGEQAEDATVKAEGTQKYDPNGARHIGSPNSFKGGEEPVVMVPSNPNDPRYKPDPGLAGAGGG